MDAFAKKISQCQNCPRLIRHCQKIAKEKRKSFAEQKYWGKPVPNFGPNDAEFIIVGLAPAAHGANRTGRMFTGDRSGDWLYRALHKAGFASQVESYAATDGLTLANTLITATCHCAPPDNKPTRQEMANCFPFLKETFARSRCKVILALGAIAWNGTIDYAKSAGWHQGARPKFTHGAQWSWSNGVTIIGSYHPSQQNTFTKKLTEPMFDEIFSRVKKILSSAS